MSTESAIYKIDGVRIVAASAQRAAADGNGDQIDTTYLKKTEFDTNSAKWDNAANEVTSHSANWNDTYGAVTANSATWNDVSSKLGTAQYQTDSATFETTSHAESTYLTKTSADVDYLTNAQYSADSATFLVANDISGKVDTSSMTAYYTTAQTSGAQEIADALAGKQNTGYYLTSASTTLDDKLLVLHNNEWTELPDTEGGYVTAAAGAGGYPDVQTGASSLKYIYLVKDSTVTGSDKYNEWIFTSAGSTTAWEKIGDTSVPLTDYVTTASTANWDVTPYSGKDGITVAAHEIGLSSDYKTQIEAVSGKLSKSDFDTWSANLDTSPYTSVTPNIISINDNTNEISGKDWTNDITATADAASANAVTTIDGKFKSDTAGNLTGYGSSAFATPDLSVYQPVSSMGDYLTTATYSTDSASWQSVYDTVSTNSANWSASYTIIDVPNLPDVTDLAPNNQP